MVSAILTLLMLGAITVPAVAAAPADSDIHVTKVIVEPSGPDMNFTIHYESSFFIRLFSFIFGAKVLQPSIEHMFANFTNVSIVSIDSNNGVAKVMVKDVSKLSGDGRYTYGDIPAFAIRADVIEFHDPDGRVLTLNDTDTLQAISGRLPDSA